MRRRFAAVLHYHNQKQKENKNYPRLKKKCNILDDILQMYKIIRIDFAGDNILVV